MPPRNTARSALRCTTATGTPYTGPGPVRWIVNALFSLLWFVVKLAVVVLVAVAVYADIRSLTRSSGE